jgi:uncharacterized membrane protein YtjA (UPF0391 family)
VFVAPAVTGGRRDRFCRHDGGSYNVHARNDGERRIILEGGGIMLRWAIIFLVIALVAAVFGFTGIATAAAGIAKFLFFLFLAVCVILFIAGLSVARRL